jgi:gluconokinase
MPSRSSPVWHTGSPTTVVLMGVTATGKSTVMRELVEVLGWPAAEGDDFHPAGNVARMRAGLPLTDEDRWPWLRAIAVWIGAREAAGESSVVTCSALRRVYRDRLRDGHPSVWFAHLVVPPDLLAARIAARSGHFMPPGLLRSQLDTLEALEPDEPGVLLDARVSPEETAALIVRALVGVGRIPDGSVPPDRVTPPRT